MSISIDLIEESAATSGGWRVSANYKYSDGLSWGEMIDQVISLTHPDIKKARFEMHSEEFYTAQAAYRLSRAHLASMEISDKNRGGR